MRRGICLLSVSAMRSEPCHRSEMVNQLIFGDIYEIHEQQPEWFYVKSEFDGYMGWVSTNQVNILSETEWQAISCEQYKTVSLDLIQVVKDKTLNSSFAVGPGCSFPFYEKGKFSLVGKVFEYSGEALKIEQAHSEQLVENAMTFLHTPYLWGGRSPMGIDCSGLTQLAYKMSGIVLPRDASQQARIGETINLINEAQAGDLLFFDNKNQEITHVGMLVSEGFIIHAHGKVRIDLIDHQGIYNRDIKKYTHQLRTIKRVSGQNIRMFR